jgi:hypothetical protein
MTNKTIRRYTVDGNPMTPDDLRRLHDYLADLEVIEVISDEMRIVVESEWPEFIQKLLPRRCRSTSYALSISTPRRRPRRAHHAVRDRSNFRPFGLHLLNCAHLLSILE